MDPNSIHLIKSNERVKMDKFTVKLPFYSG